MRMVVLSLFLLTLVACSNEEAATISGSNSQTEASNSTVDGSFNDTFNGANALALYLPEDESKMFYSNSQSTMTLETHWTSNENAILTQTLHDQQYTYNFDIHEHELHVTKGSNSSLYMTFPPEATAGEWEYVETLQSLATPYETFEHVYVLQHEINGEIERHYIAYQYGIVQFEFVRDGQTETYALQNIEYL